MTPTSNRERREADPLFRREMRERWRRPLTLLQLLVFALALALVAFGFYATLLPPGEVSLGSSLAGSGRAFFGAIARVHLLAWIPGGILLAAPTLAVERERGHLAAWLLAGLSPRGIVRAKFRALAGFVLVMVCVPFPVFALCFPLGGVVPSEFVATMIFTIAVALAATMIGLMISAQSPRVSTALGGALVMSACLLPICGSSAVAILGSSWQVMLICAALLSGFPLVFFGAAVASFDSGVRADLDADANRRPRAATATRRQNNDDAKALMREIDPQNSSRASVRATAHSRTRRDLKSEPLSSLETVLVRVSRGNALARRDFLGHLQRPRADWSDGSMRTQGWREFAALWIAVGLLGLGLKFWWPTAQIYQWFGALVFVSAIAMAAVNAAPALVRERQQRTLTALQLTALSPRDIVIGKTAAILLICAQFFAGPLVAVGLMALTYGPLSALFSIILGICCLLSAAAGTLILSLWGRKTEVIAGGALTVLFGLWLGLPMLYLGYDSYFRAPIWLEKIWLNPLRQFWAPTNDWNLALALAQLAITCALMALSLGALCAWQLQRTRADDEVQGVLQRDLSRSWR